MALTTVKDADFPAGPKKFQIFDLTFGASDTAGEVKTGLSNVSYAAFISTTDDAHDTYLNFSDAGSTAAAGSVYLNNVANSAVGKLLVIGA